PTAAAAGPAPVAAVTAVELPPPTLAPPAPPPAAPPAGVSVAPAPPTPGPPGDAPVAAPAEAETAAAAEYTTAPEIPAAIPQPPALSGGKFLWPVNGKIVSRFGATDGGLHNDGLNIAAPQGTPVRAAENGVVAYSGNELRGFGNLLLIRHADGWMSAYAHNDALLVQRGDRVARGQTIARVGRTGNVATPQLHFELRRGAGPVDPLPHLGDLGA
ncbi:MAG: M23 family metallopeptidase, partial [Dongiaceae bacterium]